MRGVVKDQITYIIGAGASYNAIPCVKGLKYRLNDLLIFLEEYRFRLENHSTPFNSLSNNEFSNLLDSFNKIIDDIKWLINESLNHQTIDTLAKRLSITGEFDDLNKLKSVLIIYFYFEQNIVIPIKYDTKEYEGLHLDLLDKRYDNLIASIADRDENGVFLNNRINIISWNYDLQLEYALKNYFPSQNHTINSIQKKNQIIPNVFKNHTYDVNKFGIIKLNGSAFLSSFTNNSSDETVYDYRHRTNISNRDNFVFEFFRYYNRAIKFISQFDFMNFAWESKGQENEVIIKNAVEVMKRTKILIIIGYSFPFFNSKIDSEILKHCIPNEIIIEDNEGELIKDRLTTLVPFLIGNLEKDKFKLSKPSGTFFIHPET